MQSCVLRVLYTERSSDQELTTEEAGELDADAVELVLRLQRRQVRAGVVGGEVLVQRRPAHAPQRGHAPADPPRVKSNNVEMVQNGGGELTPGTQRVLHSRTTGSAWVHDK